MDVTKLEQLGELRIAERQIADKIEALLPDVYKEVEALPTGAELEVSVGKFSVTRRREWTFPPEIEVKEKEIKSIKDKMKQTGEATYIENVGVTFTAGKE